MTIPSVRKHGMDIPTLIRLLDHPAEAEEWLREWGLENIPRAHCNLVAMAEGGITLDLLGVIATQLSQILPRLSDPDMALNNLERFVLSTRSPLALGGLFERDREALPPCCRFSQPANTLPTGWSAIQRVTIFCGSRKDNPSRGKCWSMRFAAKRRR